MSSALFVSPSCSTSAVLSARSQITIVRSTGAAAKRGGGGARADSEICAFIPLRPQRESCLQPCVTAALPIHRTRDSAAKQGVWLVRGCYSLSPSALGGEGWGEGAPMLRLLSMT